MSRAALTALLHGALRQAAATLNVPVGAENQIFAGAPPCLIVHLGVADEKAAALGRDAAEAVRGILYVTVVTAAGQGTEEADALKDALTRHLGRRRLENDLVTLDILSVRSGPGRVEAAAYSLPVEVVFRAWCRSATT